MFRVMVAALVTLSISAVAEAQVQPYPPDFHAQEITTNGTTIHVRVGGKGPAVVLLHGYGETGDMWAPLAAERMAHHTVIVPDLRGMGLSTKSVGGYDKKTQAVDMAGVLDTLDIDKADLVTHDIGNMVGYAFAAQYELAFENGEVFLSADGAVERVPFGDLLQRANLRRVSGSGKGEGTYGNPDAKFSTHSFGCHFVEVTWQAETARLRVSRVVTVMDAGRILNPLAARNQIEGAVVMGIGMALLEHTSYDPQNGAPMNSNLADYVMAVNADAPPMEVHFLDFPDKEINELGARGIGEIGLAGFAAAVTAAVHHATGVRVRELPVRIEHLLA
jgi:xanthine dehydrogenase molybdopterin-binding subunit B